ncbi:MAG: T9SS type A sorting domain-containing protein [Bacteroidia bacterium]
MLGYSLNAYHVMKMKFLLWGLCLLLCPVMGRAQVNSFQELWRQFGPSDSLDHTARANKLIVAQDGAFVVAGTWNDSAFVMKIDPCGDVIWRKNYHRGTKSELFGICELSNGRFATTGYCRGCASGQPPTAEKAWVILTSPQGVLVKDTLLGVFSSNSDLHARGMDILVAADGNLALTGSISPALFQQAVLFAKFTPGLSLVQLRQIRHQALNQGVAIVKAANGGFAIGGTSWVWGQPGYAHVFRCNSNGDTLWTRRSTIPDTWLNSMAGDGTNGRFIGTGSRNRANNPLGKNVFVFSVNSTTGAIQTQQDYGYAGNDEGAHIVKVNGGYLIGARLAPSSGGWAQQRDAVLRLDTGFNYVDTLFYQPALHEHIFRSIVPLRPDGHEFAFVTDDRWYNRTEFLLNKRHLNGRQVQFTRMPVDAQLYARNLADDSATVDVTGLALAGAQQYSQMRLEVFKNGTSISQRTANLSYAGNSASFSFITPIHAELSNYRFEVQGLRNGLWYHEGEACDVVAGDAYIIQGGSTAAALKSFFDPSTVPYPYWDPRNDFVRNYRPNVVTDSTSVWHKEGDDFRQYFMPDGGFNSGLWGLVLGQQIVQQHHIPVALLNGGIDTVKLVDMLPTLSNHLDSATHYGRFLKRVMDAGLQDSIRGILFFHGEANAALGVMDSVASYRNKFGQLYNAWNADFPGREHDYLFQLRTTGNPFLSALSSLYIAEAQRQIGDLYPNMDVLSTTGLYHDGNAYFHYSDGFERAGMDLSKVINRDLYGAPNLPNIEAPQIDYAYFTTPAQLEVTLHLRNANDSLHWYPGMESDFLLHNSGGVSVISGMVAGSKIILQLDGVAPTGTLISYHGHAGGMDCPVKNTNGIGLLRFYQIMVLPYVAIVDPIGIHEMQVYPNPVAGEQFQVALTAEIPGAIELTLYSIEGKRLQGQTVNYVAGKNIIPVNLPVAKGVYLLECLPADGRKKAFRVVKL